MSRTAIKIFKPKNLLNSADVVILFSLLAFIIGYIIGVILISNNSETIKQVASNSFEKMLENKKTQGFFSLLLNSLTKLLPFIFLAYILGTTMFGCALIPTLCVINGLLSGVFIAFIYNKYAINGMGFVALIIAPVCVLSAFTLILAGRESLFYSQRLLKATIPNTTSTRSFSIDFKLYSIRYLIILAFTLLVAIVDASLTSIFYKYFSFS